MPKRKNFKGRALSRTSTRTHLEGRRSVELMKLSLKPVHASRARGFRGLLEALWRLSIGTDVVLHTVFCFHMCNRLPEIMKNEDAGVFPVYYSLKD